MKGIIFGPSRDWNESRIGNYATDAIDRHALVGWADGGGYLGVQTGLSGRNRDEIYKSDEGDPLSCNGTRQRDPQMTLHMLHCGEIKGIYYHNNMNITIKILCRTIHFLTYGIHITENIAMSNTIAQTLAKEKSFEG